MNLRIQITLAIATAFLAACSGGGGSSTPQQQPLTTASGVVMIAPNIGTSSISRRPEFISPAATAAWYSIDMGTPLPMNCSGSPITCTASWGPIPAGSHSFSAEINDTTHNVTLAEGGQLINVNAGNGDLATVTLNGVVQYITFPSVTCSGSTCSGANGNSSTGYTVADFDGDVITPPETTLDNGHFVKTVSETGGSADTISLPIPGGSYTYLAWTATCNDPNSSFHIGSLTMTTPLGPYNGDSPLISPPGVTYPTAAPQVVYYTYLCDASDNISEGAQGTVNIQSLR
jgi:hypothetical protein